MSDPHDPSDLERVLLDAARTETPAPKSRAAALAAATAVLAGTAALSTAGSAGSTATASASLKVSTIAAWKAFLAGALVGGAVIGTAVELRHRGEAGRSIFGATAIAPAPPMVVNPAPTVAPLPEIPTVPIEALGSAEPSPAASARVNRPVGVPREGAPATRVEPTPIAEVPAPQPAGSPSAPALSAEIQALDRTRALLGQRNADGAIAVLDEYDRTLRGGALGPEAKLLRVEALVLRGSRDEAIAVARALVQTNPDGPHRARLRRLLGKDAP